MKNKHPPCIFRDLRGVEWITAEGIRRYFKIRVVDTRKYFYRYSDFLRRLR